MSSEWLEHLNVTITLHNKCGEAFYLGGRQESKHERQLSVWRCGSTAGVCKNISTVLGPKRADVGWTEWRQMNNNSHKIVTPVAPVIAILCVAVWFC